MDEKRLGVAGLLEAASFIPEREFDPIPEAQLVINEAEIIFDDVFGGTHGVGNFAVLAAFGYPLNDEVFALVGDVCESGCRCCHSCLLKSNVASLTRLMPPVMP
jgi:hypothetical protein